MSKAISLRLREKRSHDRSFLNLRKTGKIKDLKIDDTDPYKFNRPLEVEQFSSDEFFLPNQKKAKTSKPGKSIMRALIALIIIGGGYFYMNQDKATQRKVASTKNSQDSKKPKKVDENQLLVSDTFNTAQTYYTEKNHTACINELDRLHKLVPAYKNSKQLASLCQQGLEIEEEQKNVRQRELQAQKVEENSDKIARSCEQKFNQFKSRAALDSCLNQLLVLNPGHPTINQLQIKWDDIESQKQEAIKNKLA